MRELLNAGVVCTLNSDDPAMFETSLLDEYLLLARQGFTLAELRELADSTWRAGFLSPSARRTLGGPA